MLPRLLRMTVFMCCAAAVISGFARAATAKWSVIRTDDVVIYSDASATEMVEYAVGSIAFRQTFRELISPPLPLPPETVVLFRRIEDLQAKLPPTLSARTEQLSQSAEVDGDALVATAEYGARATVQANMCQFDTIWALRRSGYSVPLWMAQGAGEVLESLTVTADGCEVGANDNRYLWRSSVKLPWDRFFDVTTSSPEYAGLEAKGQYQAQAWALMHYVLLNGRNGSAVFNELAARLREEGPAKATTAVLGMPLENLDGEIQRHLGDKAARRRIAFDADALRKRLAPVPAPELEVHLVLSNVLFAANKLEEAKLELAQAQAIDPNSMLVKEARARDALRNHQSKEAVALYREAITLGSLNPRAYMLSAEARLNDLPIERRAPAGEGGDVAQAALAEIRKAIALDPGSPEAFLLFGRVLYSAPHITDDDITQLGRGISPGIAGEGIRFCRAILFERLKRWNEYAADIKHIANDPIVGGRLREQVKARMPEMDVKPVLVQLDQLVKAGKYDEAADTLAKTRAFAEDPAAIANFQRLEGWLVEREAWDKVRSAYDAQRWSDAATLARKFLEQFPASKAADSARHIIERADQPHPASGG